MENSAYPVGTCAERCALGTAVAAGARYGDIKAIAVATNTPKGNPASPCGMCRQFMKEFCEPTMPVLLIDEGGTASFTSMEEVCTSTSDGFIRMLITISSFYQIRLDYSPWPIVNTSRADNHRIFSPFKVTSKSKPL